MNAGEIGVFVPIVAMMIPISAIWARHRTRMMELQVRSTADVSAEKAAQYASHTRELEERVRVLERIVTDRGYDVAAQIEALRDTKSVEGRGSPMS
jgi:hypothetical protein